MNLHVIIWAGATLAFGAEINPKSYLEHVKFLASPELKGRGTGTPELERAGAYIEKQFRALGLKPCDGRGYQQPFPVTVNARLGPANSMSAAGRALKLEEDYVPFNFSSTGKLAGEVVFAGYGITAKELNYDDYEGLEVKDKIVLILRHEPQENVESSVFAGKALTAHAQFESKMANAKMHGARGVILINDVWAHPSDEDRLEKFGASAGPINAGVFFVQVKKDAAEEWVKAAGRDLKELVGAIDHDLKPKSFALAGAVRVELGVDIARDTRTVHNVCGYLGGQTDEYVVVGAHYDHLGLGGSHSLDQSKVGTPHPGADDNASGTAGVLELARWFTSQPKQKRGFVFLAFAGEELGLLGSSYYVNHPVLPLEKAVAMINMDMIGRIREGRVYLAGSGTGTTLGKLVERMKAETDLKLDLSEQAGYGSSDHTAFTTKQVPVLFFFSGLHGDYHKPTDTWDKIDAGAATKLLKVVADAATTLSNEAERPQYVRVAPKMGAVGSAGGGSGYGADFGSIPDFSEPPKGVRFADIRAGSPAEKAGLKAGDILIEFDGKEIGNLYDFTYALRSKKPGEEVLVKVIRGGETIEAKVLLGRRR